MQVSEGVELVRFRDLGEGNLQIQLAIRGVLAPMIDDHRESKARFAHDEAYFRHMARQSELLIHLYGDARNPFPEAISEGKQKEGF